MIVTVTPNTGIDYTLAIPELRINRTIRSSANAWGMGGKASDAAWVLGKLSVPVLALGFAAGMTGETMERMLLDHGVETDFVWVGGESRLNIILVCTDGSGQSTFTSSSLKVSPEHVDDLLARYQSVLDQTTCVLLGGTLPEEVPLSLYPEMIAQARDRGIPVVFDASGPALQAGLEAHPSMIKPNLDELGYLIGFTPISIRDVYREARKLQANHRTDVIVTLGGEGALALLGDRAYKLSPLSVPVASVAGAGDGVLAGLALAYSRQEPLENGLRYGFALAGAILQTLATADFQLEDYQELLPQIDLIPYEEVD